MEDILEITMEKILFGKIRPFLFGNTLVGVTITMQYHSNLLLFDLVANSYLFVQPHSYILVQFTHSPIRGIKHLFKKLHVFI